MKWNRLGLITTSVLCSSALLRERRCQSWACEEGKSGEKVFNFKDPVAFITDLVRFTW